MKYLLFSMATVAAYFLTYCFLRWDSFHNDAVRH